jgi:hypothetical protein
MTERVFHVSFDGEPGAGLHPFHDVVAVRTDADPGGKPGEWCEFLRTMLREWYDGADVLTDAEWEQMLADEDKMLGIMA